MPQFKSKGDTMPDKKCIAIGCDESLGPNQTKYCSNRCKQAVKYAVNHGRQCAKCGKEIKKPVPVLGGYKRTCHRKACNRD